MSNTNNRNIVIPPKMNAALVALAKREERSKSDLVREAIRILFREYGIEHLED